MLYIIRHGRTDWNDKKKLQGWTDIPLNENGRQMAIEAGIKAKNVHFDICFCSPLVRAIETARLFLNGRDVPIVIDDRLKEMGFGICEGIENVYEREDIPVNIFFRQPQNYRGVKNGETIEELVARTSDFLKDKVKPLLDEGKDVLIVGHGATNSCIINQIRKLPLEKFWNEDISNCKLIKLCSDI